MSPPDGVAAHRVNRPAGALHLPALDGVRALSVVGVVASHAGVFGLGWVGVDIFFGLSGFLITGILMDAKAARPTAREFFVPFYARRSLRILPLAWLVAVAMSAYRGQFSGLPFYAGYIVNWLPHSPPPRDLGHYWSLAVEEQFYLVWPAVVFFTSKRTLWYVTFGVIALDVACRFAVSAWDPPLSTHQFRDLASFARADSLAVGALLAQRQRSTGFGKEKHWALPVAVFVGVAMFAIRALEQRKLYYFFTYNLKWPLLALGVGGGLLYVLDRAPRPLKWRWMVWLGEISYGVYVIHSCFAHFLHRRFSSPPLIFVLQLALTIPAAALSWYLFETPILRNKRRWPMPTAAEPRP